MARIQATNNGTRVWLDRNDTWDWAHDWPCSTLSDKAVFAEFDSRGDLVDMRINYGKGSQDVDGHEFKACVSDFLRAKFPNHPAIR